MLTLVAMQPKHTTLRTDMKLYKLSQSKNTDWYTYDSAIVSASSIEEARAMIPSPFYFFDDGFYYNYKHQEPAKEDTDPSWCDPKYVEVEQIGTTRYKKGVVLASYKAGFDESRYLDMRRIGKAIASGTKTEVGVVKAIEVLKGLEIQLHDRGLAELRYHLIEANREHDLKKTQNYELKVRDYMNEEYEDWT